MNVFGRFKIVLGFLLVVVILWVGLVAYLNYSTVELKGRFLGMDVDYEYTLIDEEMDLTDEGRPLEYYTMPLTPYFNESGFEKMGDRIDEALVISPNIFHALQNDAVIEGRYEDDEPETQEVVF